MSKGALISRVEVGDRCNYGVGVERGQLVVQDGDGAFGYPLPHLTYEAILFALKTATQIKKETFVIIRHRADERQSPGRFAMVSTLTPPWSRCNISGHIF
jgi:hypothetical protein